MWLPTTGSLASAVLALLSATSVMSVKIEQYGGLDIEIMRIGDCSMISKQGDTISVQYKGTLQSNGKEFDSSYRPGRQPFVFTLGGGEVIQGWDVGLQEMCLGEARRLIIPPEMGYGDRGAGPDIPGGAFLVFETELVAINGISEPVVAEAKPEGSGEGMFGIATAPAEPTGTSITASSSNTAASQATPTASEAAADDIANALLPPDVPVVPPPEAEVATADEPTAAAAVPVPTPGIPPPASEIAAGADDEADGDDRGECHLLGPFAIIIQGALGGLALLSLVYKRWRETPRRPMLIWFFDVSKQVFGSVLLHVMNVFFSMLSGGSFDVVAVVKPSSPALVRRVGGFVQGIKGGREEPNPCSFYLLNLALDTTIGIPILVLFLRILHALFLFTPLARPPESLRSGNYGQPPSWLWYFKQSLIYYIALFIMKLCVYFLLQALPWLAWVGDWALRWTEGKEALQIAFTMLIFPLIMNCVQYWVIDSFIKDPAGGSGDYQGVQQEEDHDDQEHFDDETVVEEPDEDVKGANRRLKEVNPTPIPSYEVEEASSSGSSRGVSRGGQ